MTRLCKVLALCMTLALSAGCGLFGGDDDSPTPTSPAPPTGPKILEWPVIDITRTAPDPQFKGACRTNAINIVVSGPAEKVISPGLVGNDSLSGGTGSVYDMSCSDAPWKFTVGWHNCNPRYPDNNSTCWTRVATDENVDFYIQALTFKGQTSQVNFSTNGVKINPSSFKVTLVDGKWRIRGKLSDLQASSTAPAAQ